MSLYNRASAQMKHSLREIMVPHLPVVVCVASVIASRDLWMRVVVRERDQREKNKEDDEQVVVVDDEIRIRVLGFVIGLVETRKETKVMLSILFGRRGHK